MSFTLIDYFNGFQSLKANRHFSAGVQSTYFAILAEFNRQHYPEQVELSTRDLQKLAGLKSVSSTHEARNILKNNKLVDFHTRNNTTVYQLCTEHLPNTYRTAAEHLPNTSSISFPISSSKEKENKTDIQSRARESLVRETLNNNRGTEEEEGVEAIDELAGYWEHAGGAKLNQKLLSELNALLKDHTMPVLKRAIDEACLGNNNPNYGFSLNYLKLKLSEIQQPNPSQSFKGGVMPDDDPRVIFTRFNF